MRRMSGHTIWWAFGGLMVVSTAATVLSSVLRSWRNLQNIGAAAAVAQELGFTFTGWSEPGSAADIGTPLFRSKPGGEVKNLMKGSYAGLETQLFDFSFTVGTGTNTTPIGNTVVVYSQNVDLPIFEVQPEGLVEKLTDALLHRDINFDTHPQFSKLYALRGPDAEKIRAFFNDGVLSFFEGLNHDRKWHLEGSGRNLVIYRFAQHVRSDELKSFLEETSGIAKSFFGVAHRSFGL
jgi:hypothetical protein